MSEDYRIHPTAVVSPRAELGPDVVVGPYAVVGPGVRVGAGTRIGAHAVLEGRTTLGQKNLVFPFASLGAEPQDRKHRGEPTELEIGDENVIREFVTIHAGTVHGGGVTRVGNGCLLMNYAHVAHDCRLGDGVVVANGAQLGGHVVVEDHAVIGALAGLHQFVRVGESAIVGAGSMVSLDVLPYCNATGDRASLRGLNFVGLRRRGFSSETIATLQRAYRVLFGRGLTLREALDVLRREYAGCEAVVRWLVFLQSSRRGFCRPRGRRGSEGA
ncbi:MAG: acyl-[acyl-carrier-protein]--UDP-N-acetylglucosamine O-acyltransferase [Candidatus Binatia bacterium]|nr:MAG: acyl-[acyl-carrier-protein]--UDP-N-acetylglucosamine O-acyltransferase [Candidatus Binatia bacterium]